MEESGLSLQQKLAVECVRKKQNIFLTGSAGTGKSYVLSLIVRDLRRMYGPKSVFTTATTGVAACHIGGMTVNSFAGIGTGSGNITKWMKRLRSFKSKGARTRWDECKALVIDEVSMMSDRFLDLLNELAKRRKKNKSPFGGIQVVFCGDFLQMKPIDDNFCFKAKSWGRIVDTTILLKKVWRQTNPAYISMLQAVRVGKLNEEHIQTIRSRVGQKLQGDMEPVRVVAWRKKAEELNNSKLKQLSGKSKTFTAKDSGKNTNLLKGCIAPQTLELKPGASVMLVKNLDFEKGLCNGALGTVIYFHKGKVTVQFTNGNFEDIGPEEWTIHAGDEVMAKRTQIPLILAWAITAHKCQGSTIPLIQADLKTFGSAMAYVMLSRGTSLDGLYVKNFDPKKSIIVDPEALAYYENLENPKLPVLSKRRKKVDDFFRPRKKHAVAVGQEN